MKCEVQYHSRALHKKVHVFGRQKVRLVLKFIYWDCKILSGAATFHKRGVLDSNFQNPSEIPALVLVPMIISWLSKVGKIVSPTDYPIRRITGTHQNTLLIIHGNEEMIITGHTYTLHHSLLQKAVYRL